jgi:ankyrin repeat protein
MPRVPTRKRRNRHRNTYRQRGGDPIDELIQSLVKEERNKVEERIDRLFMEDKVDDELVSRILSKTDIDPSVFEHLMYIMLVKSVTNDMITITSLLLADERVDPMVNHSEAFTHAILNENLEMVKLFLTIPRFNPAEDDNVAIQMASEQIPDEKSSEIVKILLADPRVDPGANDNEALITALKYAPSLLTLSLLIADPRVDLTARDNAVINSAIVGEDYDEGAYSLPDTNLLEFLLRTPRFDPTIGSNLALRLACEQGNKDAVEMLLDDERVDPSMPNNVPILLAAQENHQNIVIMLLNKERVDPAVDDNMPLQYAAANGNKELIHELLSYEAVSSNKNVFKLACDGEYEPDINEYIMKQYPGESCTPAEQIEEVEVKYEETMKTYDIVLIEDVPIITSICNRDNIVMKSNTSYFTLNRKELLSELQTNVNTRFECKGELTGAPYATDVIIQEPYFYLKSSGNFLVRKSQIAAALEKYAIIELIESPKKIQFLASYKTVQLTPGVGLDGRDVNIVSADHCQAGTQQNVYDIRGVILQA